jgi:alpha-mannosidase
VVVDPADGSFSLNGHGPLGRIVDDGDAGDTYNWSPPDNDVFVPGPESVSVTLDEAGPVRGRLVVDMTMPMPHHIEDQARVGSALVTLQTVIEVRAGEDFVRVTTTIDNQARDHRLRVGFWLPEPTDHSEAECAFAVVQRGLEAEGGPTERPMATFPSRRFVRAGGLTFVHEGLLEYELADIGEDGLSHLIGITLLRCTGMLSQGPMTMRPLPAGPEDALEGSQMQGRTTVRYALHLGDRDPYAVVDDAFLPLQLATGEGRGDVADTGQALSVTGAEVSALLRDAGSLVLRLFNPTDAPTTATVDGRRGWLVDLRGRPLEPFEGSVDLGPHAIVTLRLDP